MFSRTKDTIKKINYDVNSLTYSNDYVFETPGNGSNPYYIKDSHIRLQKWGGNMRTNSINIENDLMGKTRNFNRDNLYLNNYKNYAVSSTSKNYTTASIPNKKTLLENNIVQRKEKIDILPGRFDLLFHEPQNHIYNNLSINTRSR